MPELAITDPQPLRVIQRTALTPPAGAARVEIRGSGAPLGATAARVRAVPCPDAWGVGTDWVVGDAVVEVDGSFRVSADICGGGWYRLEVEISAPDGRTACGVVEPVGVGEVFVVAGQSYAASCHEAVTTVTDATCRVVAASPEEPAWRFAHDPQPAIRDRVDLSTASELGEMLAALDLSFPHGPYSPYVGSIWPSFGDQLVMLSRVPVSLVHVAVGGTLIRHWAEGTQLFENLCDAAALAGNVRAVLWQQGESDVRYETTTDEYATRLVALRTAFVARTGLDVPWLPAKSTHHPTGLLPEEMELAVRAAVDTVWGMSGFRPGPDTDQLRGPDYRAGWHRGAHFTGKGQRAAGLLWAGAVHALLA